MNVADSHTVRVDPSWWLRPDLQDALANRDIGAIFQFLRGRGFSQTRIAALTDQNQSEVCAILGQGGHVTAYDVLARIADGLRIPRGLMGLAHTTPIPAIRDGVDTTEGRHVRRRAFMGIAAKITMGSALAASDLAILATPAAAGPVPEHIGSSDIQRVEAMTAALAHQDYAFGGGACREAIVGYLNWATGLRHAAMTDEVRRELDLALARLEDLAGWVSLDMLLLDSAEHFYLRSLHSARLADYPFMAAKALSRLGMVYYWDGQYGDALKLFQLAALPAREAGPTRLMAYLHLQDAQIHGLRGDLKATEEAIRRAHGEHAEHNGEPTHLARFCNTVGLHHLTGLAYSNLAAQHPATALLAIESQTAALHHVEPHETRTMLMYRIDIALNAYRSGDTELANTTTGEIVTTLPEVSSRRLTTRLHPLATEAATHD